MESLERGGTFRQAVLSSGQIMDPDSLLALRVNGADLSLDHGYPARGHRARQSGRPQHQVGRQPDLPELR